MTDLRELLLSTDLDLEQVAHIAGLTLPEVVGFWVGWSGDSAAVDALHANPTAAEIDAFECGVDAGQLAWDECSGATEEAAC